jgi:hypothetical protein
MNDQAPRFWFVGLYHTATGKNSISRVAAPDAETARRQVIEDFANIGEKVLVALADVEPW